MFLTKSTGSNIFYSREKVMVRLNKKDNFNFKFLWKRQVFYWGRCDRIQCTPSVTRLVFNVITRINEFKILVKYISCDCKCKFDSTTCNSNQKWNNDNRQRECKKYCKCKKIIVVILANPSLCVNSKYLKVICWWLENFVWWTYICYGYSQQVLCR